MPKSKSSSTRNTSSSTEATSCRKQRSTVGITLPAIRKYIPAICSIPISRSRRGRKRRSATRSPALFAIGDYDKRIAAYKEINKKAVEYGAIMPLLQSVITVVSKKDLSFEHYRNGWILADTMTRT